MRWSAHRFATLAIVLVASLFAASAAARSGKLMLQVIDADSGAPLAFRMHLKNARGRSRKVPKAPFYDDHFVFRSPLPLTLPEGNYTFEVECGPEYHTQTGHFTMERSGNDTKTLKMKRFVDMAGEGWWAGDLYVDRRLKDLDLLMQAEDLHLARVVTWSDKKSELARARKQSKALTDRHAERDFDAFAGRDTRSRGGLALFPSATDGQKLTDEGSLPLAAASDQYPSGALWAKAWRDRGSVWIDAEAPTARELPVWVAHGLIDSVRLAHHRYTRNGMAEAEPSAVSRDEARYPGATGLGRWCDLIYYQLLESGLRIPPTAGSGSGEVDSPPGHNRLYVHCEHSFSPQKWWRGLEAGRVVVTNGPLLRVKVDGQLPGHVFRGKRGETLQLQPEVKLSVKENVDYLEIVKNGRVVYAVSLQKGTGGKLPPLEFDESGWFLIRVRAPSQKTCHFATTGPFYVEFETPRISRQAANFFADWVAREANSIQTEDPEKRRKIREVYEQAEDFWKQKAEGATVD